MHLFADVNDEINARLAKNPVVLGFGALAIGLLILGFGVYALKTGRAPTKKGPDMEGANAKAMAIVWLVFGGLFSLFGVYKIVTGIM